MRPTILLTRPKEGATRFADQLSQRFGDIRIVSSALLRIEPSGKTPDLTRYEGLIFTSVNGLAYGAKGRPCYVVGSSTAEVARRKGMDVLAEAPNAEALIRRILADAPQGRLLHLRGEHARGDIAQNLNKGGVHTDEVVVYTQIPTPLTPQAKELLNTNTPVIVPIFSPRTAQVFAAQGPFKAPLCVAAISRAAAHEMGDLPTCLEVAATPDADAMLDSIQRLIDAASALEA